MLAEETIDRGGSVRLVARADIFMPPIWAPTKGRQALTINNSRYLLLEPPHHVLPPRLEDHLFGLQTAGYVPIVTHPERLSWVEANYDLIKRLVYNGNLLQLTAGSLLGRFGRRPRYWAERMLDDGLCHLLATDAHNTAQRAPRMAEARDVAARKLGTEEAMNLVVNRPLAILEDVAPSQLPPLLIRPQTEPTSTWTKLMSRVETDGRLMKNPAAVLSLLFALFVPVVVANCSSGVGQSAADRPAYYRPGRGYGR